MSTTACSSGVRACASAWSGLGIRPGRPVRSCANESNIDDAIRRAASSVSAQNTDSAEVSRAACRAPRWA